MTGFMRSGQNSRGISSLSRLLGRPLNASVPLANPVSHGQSRQSKSRRNRRPLSARKTFFQSLEPRTVLSAVSWVGGSGNWDVASNWSTGSVPGSGDDVTIDTGTTAATITIQPGDSETVHSLTTGGNDTLSFTGGSLTITAPTGVTSTPSTLSGPLDMTAGSLEAHGSVAVTVDGSSSVSGGSFFAYAGGVLDLPMVTSYTGPAISSPTMEAGDAGSEINLSNLTTLGGGFNGNRVFVHAYGGASIDVHQLPQITTGAVYIKAENSGTTIDLSALTTFKATSSNAGLESDTGATLAIGHLTTLDNLNLIIGGSASVAQITSVTNSGVEARDGATPTFTGLTTFTDDSFFALTAGILNLPAVTSYTSATNSNPTFEAGDAGSEINLSNLTTLNGATNGNRILIHAYGGASIDMHQLPQITSGAVYIKAENSGTTIDLSALSTFKATSSNAGLESDTGATLDIGHLTTLDNLSLIIGGSASVAQITSVTNSGVEARDGATPTFTGLTTFTNDSFYALTAGILNLPAVTSYTSPTNSNPTFEAGDAGSEINLSNLTTLNGATNGNRIFIHAYGGATIDMHQLPQITSGAVYIKAENSGSTIDLSALTAFEATSSNAGLESDTGATLAIGHLTTLDNLNLIIGGSASVAQITSVTNSSVEARDGATPTFTGLTTFTNDSFFALTAGILNLPAVTSYTSPTNSNPTFEAGDNGSEVNLSNLTTLNGATNGNRISIHAYGGASIDMHQLPQITSGAVYIKAENSGSTIDLSALTTFEATSSNAGLESDTGATLDIGHLTTLDNLNLIIGGSASVAQITSVTNSSVEARDGATPTFTGLTTFTNDSFFAFTAGILNIPAVTSYTSPANSNPTFEAGDNGSEVNLSNLTTLNGATNGNRIFIHAYGGATIDMHQLPQITSGAVYIKAENSGSTIDLSGLTAFTATSSGAGIEVDSGATLKLPALTTFTGGSLTLNGATLDLPVLTKGNLTLTNGTSVTVQGTLVSLPASGGSNVVINVPSSQSLAITLDNTGTFSGGTTFNVGAGSSIVLAGGTYLGGATFNLGAGSTADLTGGQTATYGGTLTATAGTVDLSGGTFAAAVGGATLNFPGNVFQWSGGAMDLQLGDVTNQGTINITAANDVVIYNDGTLDNQGTIIQSGAGNLGLHSDNVSPTTLKIEAGATYKIESDSGIDNPAGGQTAVVNAGTIVKTAGSGTSTLMIPGPLTNTGTIEADSGTLDLEASSFAQIASGTLNGGTWNDMDGATIKFHSGTSITSNAANVTLDGSKAAIPALALASNSGTLAITNGASLSTPGDFTNSGTLTLGGTLNVGGNFTQTSAGTLNEQIGGSPVSGQFGQVAATGTAALAGNLNLALVNNFTPVSGQVFPVLKYTSATGSFASITGLVSGMTADQSATEFDLSMPGAQADLSLTSVTESPTSAVDGQTITVNWQVTDLGAVNAAGSWVDSVYLSTTPTITASSILLGSVPHTGGLTATSHYNASLSKAVPALAPGNYYVIVEADSHFQVADADRANNMLAATTGQLAVSVPSLTLGTPANGTFTAADQDQYYQVTVPPGGSLVVSLTSAATSGATALYVSQGAAPTAYNYQFAATADQPNQTLTVPNASGGTYYVLVHSVSGAAATAGYSLNVSQTNAVSVSAVSPNSGGNGGNVTVEIDGANFTNTSTASLMLGSTTIDASAIDFVNSSQVFATFNLQGAALGAYTLTVNQGASMATAPTSFQVVAATAVPFHYELLMPAAVRAGRTAPFVITYENTSNNDISVRDLKLSSTNANVSFSSTGAKGTFTSSLQVAAAPTSGPANILRPGQLEKLSAFLLSGDTVNEEVEVDVEDDEDDEDEEGETDNEVSHDPNAMVGPSGFGTQQFIKPQGPLPYTVDFENDGGVAAQDVTVTQQLDPNLDWSTLQLGSFGFGPINVTVPAGLTQYQTTVSYQNVDGSALNVDVALNFNVQTGLLTATFTSLDPSTGLPPTGVTDGFLPPDNASGIGEGYVEYTVQPKSGLTTGTTVNAAASVVFDTNAPLTTKTFTNTIDAGAPTSSVSALPAKETSTSFTVSWSGTDDTGGSGIASYSVFVSDNGGPFTAFQTNTTATSATFTGVNGHTYGFYSVATDNVGNVQPTPTAAQATTTVSATPFSLTEDIYVIGTGTITVSAANGVLANDTGPSQLRVTSTTVTGAEGGTFVFHADGSFTYTPPANFPGFDYAKYTAQDASGDQGTATVNVLLQTGGVVWKFYESVLHRDPDYGGLQFWINDFLNGGKTGDIAAGFFESTELLNQIIGGYYTQYLGRAADSGGLTYYEDLWHKTGGPEQIKAGFAASPEFNALAKAQYGAYPDGWIEALYHRILLRTPKQSEVTFWEQQLVGGTSEYQVALDFFQSPEAYDNDVTGWYYEYLGRAPTLTEQADFANQMTAGANDRTIEQLITNLPEYGANPPDSPAGTGVRLPDYLTASNTAKVQASIAATDAVFGGLA